MDGATFQGMPRIALTPAEEALIPRPHSSASQVATAIPSTYTRTTPSNPSSPPRPHQKNRHNSISITQHPYYNNNSFVSSNPSLAAHLGLTPSSSAPHIPVSHNSDPYTRPTSPPLRPSTPQLHTSAGSGVGATGTGGSGTSAITTQEQEYPQNPQDSFHAYYSQVPPSRSASPGPSRLSFSLTPRPVRSPSPQLYNSPYDYHQPRPYFHRSSIDIQRRPGSPLGQDRQESWGGSSILMESPNPVSDSEDDDDSDESGDGNDSDDEGEGNRKQHRRRRSSSRPSMSTPSSSKGGGILKRLRDSTSRISFGDDVSSALHRHTSHAYRTSLEAELAPRNSQDSLSLTSSRPGGVKEVHPDLSDEERHVEPRRSRSGWRPSLSLIRQESSSSNANQYYLQNDPSRISDIPNSSGISSETNNNSNNLLSNISNISNAATNGHASNITSNDSNISKENRRRRTKDTNKDSKKKRRRKKKKRAERLAQQQRQQQLLYEQQLAEQALHLPSMMPVLEKKTRYPLRYDDFEAYLRSQRAAEYLNFWADVTAHEQLCRTFDVSERRHKREQQLEERAIARDKRRTTLLAAMEAGRFTPDPYLLAPGHYAISPSSSAIGFGSGTGVGIGASSQDLHGPNMYASSRSSLQLPLNDHLSLPSETRRNGLHDPSGPFPPPHPQSMTGSYNRLLTGAGGTGRISGEMSRPSLEEEHITEQDAAVAAVAMRAQRNDFYPFNPSREDVRRGSLDHYQPMLGGGGVTNMRYQHNNDSNGYMCSDPIPLSTSYSVPNAYNMLMRGRGSVDATRRPNSRNSRSRLSVAEEYYGNGVRRMSSQQFQQQQNPHVNVHDETGHPNLYSTEVIQETSQDEHDDSPEAGPVTTTDTALRQQASQHSIGFAEPELGRRSSMTRFGGGSVGPLQPSTMVRRSGESSYAPSHFSTSAMESKAMLVQSFRAISLEDLQESALRIYRKYLIQLRTASMAAEEEAAAASADKNQYDSVLGRYKRSSMDKAMAPGWDGYAEEVIAQWNESWKGRSHEARRSRRLSGRRSFSTRGGTYSRDGETTGQPSAVSEEMSSQLDQNSSDGGHGHGGGLSINTQAAITGSTVEDKDKDNEDESSEDDEGKGNKERKARRGREGSSSVPNSPKSPRLRKKTGTGFSAMLNPLFSRLIRTETTVVELPTLTINTTTIEEATAGDDSDDEEEDEDEEYDEDEDYDSDEEEDDDDNEDNDEDLNGGQNSDTKKDHGDRKAAEEIGTMDPGSSQPKAASSKDQRNYEVVLEVRDRSVPPFTPSHAQEPEQVQHQHQQSDQTTLQNVTMESNDLESGMGANNSETLAGSGRTPRRQSTDSTLSSSWGHIAKSDVDKQETILPPPISTSLQSLPSRRSGLPGVRSTTEKAAKSASRTAHRVGSHISALLTKSIRGGSSTSSLDVIPVTPATPGANPQHLNNQWLQIPPIVMGNTEKDKDLENVNEKGDHGTLKDGHPLSMSASGTNISFAQLQDEPAGTSVISEKVTGNSRIEEGSTPQPPKQVLSPEASSVQMSVPTLSPAAVAVSAAAAAFYLPLECRQRIHTQVQEEGRTDTPYLFGPAKGFVMDVVLDNHYYPMFLEYVERHNLGLLSRHHPNNVIKRKGMIWLGILTWLVVLGIQLMLVLMGIGGWSSPWVWVVGTVGGWTGSICLATGVKEFSPILGLLGKMCEDRYLFRFRKIQEPSIQIRHRFRAYWMLSYCIFWSTVIMVVFAALPQRNTNN